MYPVNLCKLVSLLLQNSVAILKQIWVANPNLIHFQIKSLHKPRICVDG